MNNQLRTISFYFHTAWTLLAVIALQFPIVGHCDSGSGVESISPDSTGSNKFTAHKISGAPRGKYFLRLSSGGNKEFCTAFTGNLNQFRHLDFNTCDSRLSPKYPQLSRPQWEEIPLDMDLAKKILTDRPSIGFERWLKVTETARAKGEIKMWRIRVDLIGDGHLETLVRLDHAEFDEHAYCSYFDSKQMIVDIPSSKTAKWYADAHLYNVYRLGSDMIYDTSTKRYYLLDWNRWRGSSGHGEDVIMGKENCCIRNIGATASLMVYTADSGGVGPACWIDWVPTDYSNLLKQEK